MYTIYASILDFLSLDRVVFRAQTYHDYDGFSLELVIFLWVEPYVVLMTCFYRTFFQIGHFIVFIPPLLLTNTRMSLAIKGPLMEFRYTVVFKRSVYYRVVLFADINIITTFYRNRQLTIFPRFIPSSRTISLNSFYMRWPCRTLLTSPCGVKGNGR